MKNNWMKVILHPLLIIIIGIITFAVAFGSLRSDVVDTSEQVDEMKADVDTNTEARIVFGKDIEYIKKELGELNDTDKTQTALLQEINRKLP